ncbi:MAG TPA: hypothetical protein VG755_06445, partial [Nannocystaceae bacterium]|nr:hypothetical protein [Nannocystaceae bacterium]
MSLRLSVGLFTSLTLAWPSTASAEAPAPTPTPAASAPDELPPGFDKCERHGAEQRFRITLPKEAELADLVNWMSSVSCQKFIWDPAVRGGKVSVLAPEAVTLREAYVAFHS